MPATDVTAPAPGRATNNGNTRVTGTEQYYTPADTAEALTAVMFSLVKDPGKRVWLEPAAGTGSFMVPLRARGVKDIVAYDIQPKAPGITEGNFLNAELTFTGGACLTNPPFGRNHSLSVPFFNKAAQHCDYIGFVVPRSWRKWTIINRLDANMHLVHDVDLTVSYVGDAGEKLAQSSILRTVFQVWERRDVKRERITVPDRGYITKCAPELADAALTIFGRGCGRVTTDFPRRPNTTQMFIKATPAVVEALRQVDLSRFYSNVAFVEALSLAEINFCLNEYFDTAR